MGKPIQFKFTKILLSLLLLSVFHSHAINNNSQNILINEFMASNSNGLLDEDQDRSDWIELYNPSAESTFNLKNWTITDNEKKPTKWVFPEITMSPGSYLIIFASGKNRNNPNNELHTNFSLSKDGEYLALLEPDGTVSDSYAPVFPPQLPDVSYGYYDGTQTFLYTPTPGAANIYTVQAAIPEFSIERGYYTQSVSLALSSKDPTTTIYYTLDGTTPNAQSTLYSVPIIINKNTRVRAVGVKSATLSDVVTHTYLFVQDIINQSASQPSYPDRWGKLGSSVKYNKYKVGDNAPAHYAMSSVVVNHKDYASLIKDAFYEIPSLCITTNPDNLFSHENDETKGGIYVQTDKSWERPISLEYFDPIGKQQFQINCGIRMHGAASRLPEKAGKHSFKIYFKKDYGEGKLKFDLFDDSTAVNKFDHLVLRAGFGYCWLHHSAADQLNSQYILDSFAKRMQRKMGHPSTHDKFVHLYINGLYWGLYNITERIRDNYLKINYGGEEEDYDVLSHNGVADGNNVAFNRMVSLAEQGKYDDLIAENLLDMTNFIDYVLLNYYMGNWDWGTNNWYAERSRINPGKGFRFYSWDAENCFFTGLDYNLVTGGGRLKGSYIWRILSGDGTNQKKGLLQNADFKLLFADRVQKHFLNGGLLTPNQVSHLYNELAEEIDLALIAESARWGSYRRDVLPGEGKVPLYTRNDHFYPKQQYLNNNYFPYRTAKVYQQLKSANYLPAIDAPVFSTYGGNITESVQLSMSALNGQIYYTTNGNDPRENKTGNISGSATLYKNTIYIDESTVIKARVKNGNVWSALSEANFFYRLPNNTSIPQVESSMHIYYANNALHVKTTKDTQVQIQIYTIDGICVMDNHINSNYLDISSLTNGLYIYIVKTIDNKRYSGKFVK